MCQVRRVGKNVFLKLSVSSEMGDFRGDFGRDPRMSSKRRCFDHRTSAQQFRLACLAKVRWWGEQQECMQRMVEWAGSTPLFDPLTSCSKSSAEAGLWN